jgi:tetratricopeptide (TPR) repeat protein
MTRNSGKPSIGNILLGFYRRYDLPLLCCLLLLSIIVAFAPSLRNDFVNYDDPDYVTENEHVQRGLSWEGARWAFSTTEASNWHPLTWLSHMADCQMFGLHSWGHHLTSAILHALNTCLVLLVLRRMTGALWRSLFVAALFGLHPLHVQSVAWVAERKDVLSTLFFLLTIWAYASYVTSVRCRVSSEERLSRCTFGALMSYALALVFFALALMSKPMVVTLPFVLLLLDYWPLQRWQPFRAIAVDGTNQAKVKLWKLVLEKVPFFALAAAGSVITFLVQKDSGALKKLTGMGSFIARSENALIGYCRYLGKVFYPVKLAVFYPFRSAWPVAEVVLAACLLIGVCALVIALRGNRRYLLVGWFWYLGTLVPTIGLVQVGGHSIADRYTYIPLIGVFILLAWASYDFARQWSYGRSALAVISMAVILLSAGLTRWQLGFWHDSETLFRHSLAVTEDNALARVNLGAAIGQKSPPEALKQLEMALRLVPDDPDLQFTVGNALIRIGYPHQAIIALEASLAVDPGQGRCRLALGKALEKAGLLDQAIVQYREAVRIKPGLLDTHNDLGLALCNKGEFEQAIKQFEQALRLDPNSADTHNFLGFALGQAGRAEEAIRHYEYALKLNPRFAEAYSRLGVVFLGQGRLDDAVQQFQQALKADPKYADAHVNWGVALYRKGDLEGAANQFRQALALDPTDEHARKNLKAIIAKKGGSAVP